MTELMQKAINRLQQLNEDDQDTLALRILEMIETEEYLVDDVDAEEVLYEFVNEAGEVDLAALDTTSAVVDLDDLYHE